MNRDTIKYIAVFTMLLNHIGHIFLTPPWSVIFIDIGYFTAITMCYFLVEGYRYTRSRKNYARRLLIGALLSQLPFSMAFAGAEQIISFQGFNMMFNLLSCFLLICVWDQVEDTGRRNVLTAGLALFSAFCDWSLLAPAFVLLFYTAGDSEKEKRKAWIKAIALHFLYSVLGHIKQSSILLVLAGALGAISGQVLAAICILYVYNGRRTERFKTFSQYFFYAFYPLHLLVLGVLRVILEGHVNW
ncbi:MAG: conjugal transfer protein TraX [Eubacterium sp.]|nr:conjugal transfer protein TraX [Eubacterium sp.]